MARADITVQVIALTGLGPTYAAGNSVDGMQFVNDGNTFLQVKNASGAPINVTITPAAKAGAFTIAPQVIAVPETTGDRMIGPFDPSTVNNAGGLAFVDLSAATSVTVAAIRLPKA